jgi:hypothetical protein
VKETTFQIQNRSNVVFPRLISKSKIVHERSKTLLHFSSLYLFHFGTPDLLFNPPLSEGRAGTAWEPSLRKIYFFPALTVVCLITVPLPHFLFCHSLVGLAWSYLSTLSFGFLGWSSMCDFGFRGWAASNVESYPTFRQILQLPSSEWFLRTFNFHDLFLTKLMKWAYNRGVMSVRGSEFCTQTRSTGWTR